MYVCMYIIKKYILKNPVIKGEKTEKTKKGDAIVFARTLGHTESIRKCA